MMRNFYRNVNGRVEDDKDPDQVDSLVQSLATRGYVWRNLLADFVASDAFRSAPALPARQGARKMGILKDLKFSRRYALRGALSGIGVAMWLPVLDIMCNESGTAFAQGAPLPTTFGIFFWGNGIHPGSLWTPTATGNGNAWQLPPNLQDFADLKDAMTLVTGLDMMDGVFKGHGWGVVYVLAGGDGTICNTIGDINKSPYGGLCETAQGTQWQPTLDQVIADAIHTNEPYKSLETGILKYTGMNMGTASLNLAHRGPNMPLAPQRDPATLFNNLFSKGVPPTTGGGMTPAPTDISNKLRRSVLDAVLNDATRLKTGLGSADAKRIDAHMDSVRALEMRIPTTASGTNPTWRGVHDSGDSDGAGRELGLGEGDRHEPDDQQTDRGGARLQHDAGLLPLVVRRARRQPLSDHPA